MTTADGGFIRSMQHTASCLAAGVLQLKRRTRIRYTDSQKALMWDRWQKGESLHQIKVVKQSIRRTKRLALDGLVVVMPDVRGFHPPGVVARKEMVTEWATSAQDKMINEWGRLSAGSIKLVLVVPENYIDRERIGVAIARIHGLTANVVSTEQEAVEWLASTKLLPRLPRVGPLPPHHRGHHHHR